MTFGHTGEAHWAELNTASALGSLAPAPKVKVKVRTNKIHFEMFDLITQCQLQMKSQLVHLTSEPFLVVSWQLSGSKLAAWS